jgi:hypothetical protein
MSKTKTFKLNYKVEAENLEKVICLAFEIRGEMEMEPECIVLHDGRVLPWNGFLADKFAAEGHITEAEFIEMSLSQQ